MDLLCFADRKRAVTSLFSDGDFTPPPFILGEVVPVGVSKILQRQTNGPRIWDVDPEFDDTWLVEIGLGKPNLAPISGTFTLQYGADNTTDLPFDISIANLELALNALASIIAAGGVTVLGVPGNYQVVFTLTGHRTILTGIATELAPTSIIEIGRLVDGAGGHQEVQVVKVSQEIAAKNTLSTYDPVVSIAVTVVHTGGGGFNQKNRFTFSAEPYDGQWTLNISATDTGFIPFDASADTVKAAIEAIVGAGNVQVVKEDNLNWLIQFIAAKANTAVGTITAVSALKSVRYLRGELDLRSGALDLLMGSAASITATLEVQGTPSGGDPVKLYRTEVTVLAGVIKPASLDYVNTLAFQAGSVNCPIGTTSPVLITFPSAFPVPPKLVVSLASKDSVFTTFVAQPDADNIVAGSALVNLSGTIATHDHVLHWHASVPA